MRKVELISRGVELAERFCIRNALPTPELRLISRQDWQFGVCAYYRPSYIAICIEKCAAVGTVGRAWSWPGYVVDRTPYGVVQHELGHHVDYLFSNVKGAYFGDYSKTMRELSGEKPLTGYCPNSAEWFAEIFRLFVTNPNLLSMVRPVAFKLLAHKLFPVETRPWRDVLAGAPERTIVAASRKIGD